MSTPSDKNDNKDNKDNTDTKDKQPIKKKVNIKQNKIPVIPDIPVNNANDTTEITTLATDKKDKKDKNDKKDKKDKEDIPKKTIVRGGKKIKKADDTNYLRLPEDIKTGVIDFYNSIKDTKIENDKNNKIGSIRFAISQIHQKLWESQQLKPDSTLEEVMNLMFLKYLSIFASETNENGKIDLLNQAHYMDENGKLKISIDTFTKCLYYIKNFNLMYTDMLKCKNSDKKSGNQNGNLEDFRCNSNEGTDYIKGITDILKLHPVTKLIFNDKINDILQIRNPETLLGLF